MLKEAKFEALLATGAYAKIGATKGVEVCRVLLQDIEKVASHRAHSKA
jgi:hypothetical protein